MITPDEALRYVDECNESKTVHEIGTSLFVIKDLAQQVEDLQADAARYRWLREQDWFNGELCVLRNPKVVLTRGSCLGADCPSGERLDAAIDEAMK